MIEIAIIIAIITLHLTEKIISVKKQQAKDQLAAEMRLDLQEKLYRSYDENQLISFCNSVLESINDGNKQTAPDGNYEVSHADIQNWKG